MKGVGVLVVSLRGANRSFAGQGHMAMPIIKVGGSTKYLLEMKGT